MNKLHANSISDHIFVPEEGQRDLACSNKKSLRCPSLSVQPVLSEDTLDALDGLGSVLKKIHKRMIAEGYEIANGKINKKTSDTFYE